MKFTVKGENWGGEVSVWNTPGMRFLFRPDGTGITMIGGVG